MEKGQGPPPGMAAPPYPGPPLDPNIGVYQAQPASFSVPPQPAVMYAPQQAHVVQHVSQVVVVQPPTDAPGQMICPRCQNNVVTTVKHKNGLLTWLICGVLAVFICWPCCLIPFCVDDCKDVEHSCPTCQQVLHTHKRL